MKSFFYRIACGFFLGISIFAPGFSGSIMAILMGIYDKLIAIVANPFRNFKKNILYLLPMGIGAAISLILFVLSFSRLFENYPRATCLLFIGLIAGNLPVVWKHTRGDTFKAHYAVGMVVAFGLALALALVSTGLPTVNAASVNLVYMGLCGLLAGIASLIPGMSISMILLVLGVYGPLLEAARHIDIPVLLVVGGLFVVAMVTSSRLIKFIFARYPSFSYCLVFGFMCGSLAGLLFSLPPETGQTSWLGIPMVLLGLAVSVLFFFLGKKFSPAEEPSNH